MELQNRKIVILGAGHVGSHAGYSLIAQGLAEEIVYIDIDQRKAEAQALDLFDATNYLPSRAKVRAGTYADAKDAQLLIVAVGPLPDMSKGQTRMDTLHQTIPILKDVVESIRTSGFSGIILSISNPADVMVHYIQSQLNWPSRKILSTSTTLDSARLRRAIAEATGVDQKSISAYALGEHGESQMVCRDHRGQVPDKAPGRAAGHLRQAGLTGHRKPRQGSRLDHPGGKRLHRVWHCLLHLPSGPGHFPR